jgi:hypothetical protein
MTGVSAPEGCGAAPLPPELQVIAGFVVAVLGACLSSSSAYSSLAAIDSIKDTS